MPRHLRSVDVVRVITVASVISVHAVSSTTSFDSQLAGAVSSFLHVNRDIFILLSAFVLTYAYGRRPDWRITSFWRRRYLLIGVPYVCWSAIYVALDAGRFSSVGQGMTQFGYDLLTGTASFQLYFLLLTMQLYLIFPLLRRALNALQRHHLVLLVTSFLVQVGFTSIFYYWPTSPGILGYWSNHPTTNLVSYEFFVVAGGIAALHFDQLSEWVAEHRRLVIISVGATISLSLINYYAGLSFLGMTVARASQVFQPFIAVEAVVFALGLFCLGQWAAEGNPSGLLRAAGIGADASFGVYLAHPLILTSILIPLLKSAGIMKAVRSAGVAVTLLFDLAVIVPVVYVICALGVILARRTRFSLALTGRPPIPRQSSPGAEPRPDRAATRSMPRTLADAFSWFNPAGINPAGINPAGINPVGITPAQATATDCTARPASTRLTP